MAIENFISEIDANILVILLSAFIGILAWIFKNIIEFPLKDAKNTFFRFTEKRIESLCEISNVLLSIAFSPSDKQLRKKLKDLSISSKMAYLNQKDNEAIIEIVSQDVLDETKVLNTIKEIQKNLVVLINDIRKNNQLYLNHSAVSPWEKIISYIKLLLQFVLVITILGIIIFVVIKLIEWKTIWGGVIAIILVGSILFAIRYIKILINQFHQ